MLNVYLIGKYQPLTWYSVTCDTKRTGHHIYNFVKKKPKNINRIDFLKVNNCPGNIVFRICRKKM